MSIEKLVDTITSNDGQRTVMIIERGIGYRVTMFDVYFETSKEAFVDKLDAARQLAEEWTK